MIVGLGLAIFQQITGIDTIMYYAPTIFKFAGITAVGPAILAGAGLSIVMWLFHVLSIFLLDRVGRRPLLLIGVVARLLGSILGAAFQFQQLASFLESLCRHWGFGDLCGVFRLRARADLLADDLQELSA